MTEPTKLQQITQAMIEADIDQGHATREQAEMQWGRYEMLARTAVEDAMEPNEAMLNAARDWSVAKYGRGVGNDGATGCWQAMLKSILEGKS